MKKRGRKEVNLSRQLAVSAVRIGHGMGGKSALFFLCFLKTSERLDTWYRKTGGGNFFKSLL
jgi:hypothetical protein